MKITPLDVRKHEFKKSLRGYEPEEVALFLDLVAKQMEDTLRENAELREAVSTLQTRLADYERMETTLRDALLTAERAAAQCKENAEREAKLVVKEAEHQAEKTIEQARQALVAIRGQLLELSAARETFASKFRALLEAQRKVLDMYESEFVGESLERIGAREKQPEQHAQESRAAQSA